MGIKSPLGSTLPTSPALHSVRVLAGLKKDRAASRIAAPLDAGPLESGLLESGLLDSGLLDSGVPDVSTVWTACLAMLWCAFLLIACAMASRFDEARVSPAADRTVIIGGSTAPGGPASPAAVAEGAAAESDVPTPRRIEVQSSHPGPVHPEGPRSIEDFAVGRPIR